MSRYKYDAETKARAVRRVVRDGRSVSETAREFGVSEGSLFFCVDFHAKLSRDFHPKLSHPVVR